jgi:pSer/pThr/pTyr-binding forkhead associated (FHA) protein
MPYIQFQDQQFPLGPLDLTVGAFGGAAVRLPGDDPKAHAVLKVGADGTGIIRRGSPDAVVLLNGLQLGMEPSPILHGDKVELGGHALRYGDDKKGGSTQFISAMNIPDSLKSKAGGPRKATTATGGRLVSLVDGREYAVPDAGVSFGREIGCDIVIASTDVSRKHAAIAPLEGGYVLTDMSTNGVFVNATRVSKTQVLGRGDVVKIGPEEFRFYADVAKPAPAVPASAPAASAPPSVPAETAAPAPVAATPPVSKTPFEAPVTVPMPVAPKLSNTAFIPRVPSPAQSAQSAQPPVAPPPAASPPAPSESAVAPPPASPSAPASAPAPAPAARKPLAVLEITNEGPSKGKKFELFSLLTNVGRGPHNDVAINDESMSDSHAKILKREGAWWIVDQGSTNGTYVGGRRVQGEQQMVGAPDVRFGGIKMIFRPTAVAAEDEGKGTRAIAAFHVEAAKRMSVPLRSTAASPKPSRSTAASPTPLSEEPTVPTPVAGKQVAKKGCMTIVAFFVALSAMGASMLGLLLSARG